MSLKKQLEALAIKARLRTEAATKTAVQAVARDMNTPIAEGGRMPVDTGFLRNSIGAAAGSLPSGPSSPKDDAQGNPEAVAVALTQWNLDEPFYIGYSAEYARIQEARNGFIEGAAQNWPDYFDAALKRAKQEIK